MQSKKLDLCVRLTNVIKSISTSALSLIINRTNLQDLKISKHCDFWWKARGKWLKFHMEFVRSQSKVSSRM